MELLAFVLYFAVVIGIGVYFFIRTRGGGEKDYFLGGRNMNSWVTALSAQASDMSAWLLMGLPGSILAIGMGKVWIAIGLLIGTVLNWCFVAPKMRQFSKAAGDSITIPEYLTNRFLSKSPVLRVICGIVFLVCFTVYTAASLKSCGIVFDEVFDIGYEYAVVIAAGIIFLYTFMGGYAAVCWTDFVQGMLMLAALLIVPILAFHAVNSGEVKETAELSANYWNLLPSGKFDWASISEILGGLAWGLGYFGMPHILVRFMSAKNLTSIKKSRKIAIVWVILALLASAGVGLVGRYYLPGLASQPKEVYETVFIKMSMQLFPAFLGGLVVSGILAAAMSTADSQLLVSSSAFTSDIYKTVIRKNARDNEIMRMGRLIVLLISLIAMTIALNPGSGSIMDLVENAWAGFGSSFGPVILLSLFWKRFNYKGAVAGIVAGAVTDVVWFIFLKGPTSLYELIPGFIVGFAAAVICTLATEKPSEEVEALYDRACESTD